jgi:hypothetical protein
VAYAITQASCNPGGACYIYSASTVNDYSGIGYSGPLINADAWNNFVVTYTAGLYKVYVNNVFFSSFNEINTYSIDKLVIGGTELINWNYPNVRNRTDIRQVCFFDQALTAEQVSTLYTLTQGNNIIGGGQPPPSLLVSLKAVNYSGSGSWNDESGNGHNATLENGSITKNITGNGIVLDGSTSWTFSNVAVGNAWTMNVWFKLLANSPGYPQIVGQNFSNGISNMFLFADQSNFNVCFFNQGFFRGNVFNFVLGDWTNVQATWDGTSMKTYLNGILYGTTTPGGSSSDANAPYLIGRDVNSNYVTGEIGEVRIYNYAIDQTKVTTDYNDSAATFAP